MSIDKSSRSRSQTLRGGGQKPAKAVPPLCLCLPDESLHPIMWHVISNFFFLKIMMVLLDSFPKNFGFHPFFCHSLFHPQIGYINNAICPYSSKSVRYRSKVFYFGPIFIYMTSFIHFAVELQISKLFSALCMDKSKKYESVLIRSDLDVIPYFPVQKFHSQDGLDEKSQAFILGHLCCVTYFVSAAM